MVGLAELAETAVAAGNADWGRQIAGTTSVSPVPAELEADFASVDLIPFPTYEFAKM